MKKITEFSDEVRHLRGIFPGPCRIFGTLLRAYFHEELVLTFVPDNGWQHILSYETDAMSRDQIARAAEVDAGPPLSCGYTKRASADAP